MNALFLIICAVCFNFQDSLEKQLEKMVWKNRVVVVYCPKASDAEFKLQKKWLSEVGKDFMERDLRVIDCFEANISTEDALHLKERFKYTPNHFCFWLIGKDGEIKLVSDKPVKPEQLFGLIDSMPMRRAEAGKN
ncbi:hypothetical protein DR864_00590 [Runella rosea]|uniref:DUF4174 domain-containing protein n=1 Tax=Runella rosea TaxID=2259595 RepID=A0A344TCF4_9BACT|nr:DUF4174 domain-containing protein [Runella rosea]AXE16325.1 hypothetical protein DR864_00590 [Runella rosea]